MKMKLMIVDDHDGMRTNIRALIAAPTAIPCWNAVPGTRP